MADESEHLDLSDEGNDLFVDQSHPASIRAPSMCTPSPSKKRKQNVRSSALEYSFSMSDEETYMDGTEAQLADDDGYQTQVENELLGITGGKRHKAGGVAEVSWHDTAKNNVHRAKPAGKFSDRSWKEKAFQSASKKPTFRTPSDFDPFNLNSVRYDLGLATPPSSTTKRRVLEVESHDIEARRHGRMAALEPKSRPGLQGRGRRSGPYEAPARKQPRFKPARSSFTSRSRVTDNLDPSREPPNLSEPPAGWEDTMNMLSELPRTITKLQRRFLNPMTDLANKVNALTDQVNQLEAENVELNNFIDKTFASFANDTNTAMVQLRTDFEETKQLCDEVMESKEAGDREPVAGGPYGGPKYSQPNKTQSVFHGMLGQK